jgi:OFA family oxalate/formate antiporter-like MFS transporter
LGKRWLQLAAGIVGMVAVANFQYGWTFFVNPLHEAHGWEKEKIQVAFTLFVLAETWLVPLEAYLADRFGPRRLLLAGGALAALAWALNSVANSLTLLYAAQVVGGCGAGMVYGTSIGCALKWFPHRRGLAAGLTAAAFGMGSALTVLPILFTIRHAGYPAAFLWFGLGQGLVVVLAALVVRFPRPDEVPAPVRSKVEQSGRDFTPGEALRTPVFWLLYGMMTLAATGGVMLVAQMAPVSRDWGVEQVPVTLLGVTLAALPFAQMLDRLMGGVTRPLFGWVSDHVGREKTMAVAFALEGAALLLLVRLGHDPVWFVVLSGVAFFGWGAAFSLFPALTGDLFGRKYATTNYGLMYTAKGTATLLVPLGSYLFAVTGSWWPIFVVVAGCDWTAALLALFVLRTLRRRLAGPATPAGKLDAGWKSVPGSAD